MVIFCNRQIHTWKQVSVNTMYTVYLDYRKWTIGFYDVVGFSQQIMVRLLPVRLLQTKVRSLHSKVTSLHQISDFTPNISYFTPCRKLR